MKFLQKLAIVSILIFVIGFASSNTLKSQEPVYEVPSIEKNNSVNISLLNHSLLMFISTIEKI